MPTGEVHPSDDFTAPPTVEVHPSDDFTVLQTEGYRPQTTDRTPPTSPFTKQYQLITDFSGN